MVRLGLSVADFESLTREQLGFLMRAYKDKLLEDLKIKRKFVADIVSSGNVKRAVKPEEILPLEGDGIDKELLKRLTEWRKKSIK